MDIASVPGTLRVLDNAHITRGGEIEKALSFVEAQALPAGETFGCAASNGTTYVFGSVSSPTIPAAAINISLTYQQLVHPTSQAMSKVLSVDFFDGKPYVAAQYADGSIHHFYNGSRVTDWFDGRARASIAITGGTVSVGVNKISSIKVGGVEVLSGAVNMAGTTTLTAAALATNINAFTSSPNYTATSTGAILNVIAAIAATADNGLSVVTVVAGDVTIDPASTVLDGGADSSTFGAVPGEFVKTVKSKMYSTSGSLLHYAQVDNPTEWNNTDLGAGFDNLSNNASGSENLTALATYFSNLAIFAEESIQIWFVDVDPVANQQLQVLNNTGTFAPRSVREFGDNDVFYLSKSGVRSLRARDSSNAAFVNDVGTAIDDIIVPVVRDNYTEAVNAVSVVEPRAGRYMLALDGCIYVFSFFPTSKISAWSCYKEVNVTDMTVFDGRVLSRVGDTISMLGGSDQKTYDTSVVMVELPYLTAGQPGHQKSWTGIDVACEGTWDIYVNFDPDTPTEFMEVGQISENTYGYGRLDFQGQGTHCKIKLVSSGAGAAKIGNLAVHFKVDEEE
ncbi:MAG: hypothetical protein JKY94_00940 [Rhodobacteraceae bacterium]|nr:hypothetical protein [Paracoccaceae bacterium]